MVQTSSLAFQNARFEDTNRPTYSVEVDRGNYAWNGEGASATATSEFSSDFPASGAINGDRTALNYGPASGAENDVGRSGWRAASAASGGTPQRLTVAFGQSRPVNRVVLYFHPTLADGVPSDFLIETSPDGTTFTTQATITGNAARKVLRTFTQVNATHLRISTTAASGDGRPVILEAESYATVDISDRIIGLRIARRREFTQNRYLAAEVTLTVSNVDFFFSPRYTPKTTDAGFFNSEWRPNMPVRVKVGFSNENLPQFDGVIDRIEQEAGTRTATIKCRDRLKQALQRKVSAKLQSGLSLESAIIRLANFANIATQDIAVDTSTITFAQFFPQDVNIYDEMMTVIQSAGDAVLYMDESGTLRFKMFLNSIPQSQIWDSQAEWGQAGTSTTNISTGAAPGDLRIIDGPGQPFPPFGREADPNLKTYPANVLPESDPDNPWTVATSTIGGGTINTREISPAGQYHINLEEVGGPTVGDEARVTHSRTEVTSAGTNIRYLAVVFKLTSTFPSETKRNAGIGITLQNTAAGGGERASIWIRHETGDIGLGDYGTGAPVATIGATTTGVFHTFMIRWIEGSQIEAYFDNGLKFATSATLPSVAGFTHRWDIVLRIFLSGSDLEGDIRIDKVGWLETDRKIFGEWISQEVDLTTDVLSYDRLSVFETPSAFASQFFIKVADVSGGPYTEFSIPANGVITGVPVKRFVKVRAFLAGTWVSQGGLTATPIENRYEFVWFTSAGSPKFTPASSLTIRSSDILLRFSTALTDETGGASPLINRSVVKANPFYLDVAAVTAWEATAGGQPLSGANPLTLPVGDTVFNLDYGEFMFEVPQTVNFTKTGGTVTTALTSHPNKPVLTVTVSGSPAVFTALNTTARKFIQRGTIIALSVAEDKVVQEFGTREEVIENNYIQNSRMAQTIAATRIAAFKKPQELAQATVRLLPDLQLQDRLTMVEINTGTNADYQLVGMDHNLAVSGDSLQSETSVTAIAVPT